MTSLLKDVCFRLTYDTGSKALRIANYNDQVLSEVSGVVLPSTSSGSSLNSITQANLKGSGRSLGYDGTTRIITLYNQSGQTLSQVDLTKSSSGATMNGAAVSTGASLRNGAGFALHLSGNILHMLNIQGHSTCSVTLERDAPPPPPKPTIEGEFWKFSYEFSGYDGPENDEAIVHFLISDNATKDDFKSKFSNQAGIVNSGTSFTSFLGKVDPPNENNYAFYKGYDYKLYSTHKDWGIKYCRLENGVIIDVA